MKPVLMQPLSVETPLEIRAYWMGDPLPDGGIALSVGENRDGSIIIPMGQEMTIAPAKPNQMVFGYRASATHENAATTKESPCQLCGDVYPHKYLFDLKDDVDGAGNPVPGPKVTCLKCWGKIEERARLAAILDGLYERGPAVGNVGWRQAWGSGVLDAAALVRESKPAQPMPSKILIGPPPFSQIDANAVRLDAAGAIVHDNDELLATAERLLRIVVAEFDCGGEKECVKRYQIDVDAARKVIGEMRAARAATEAKVNPPTNLVRLDEFGTIKDAAQEKAELFMQQLNAARNAGVDTTPYVFMLARLIREGGK